jgi:hypothetical protein
MQTAKLLFCFAVLTTLCAAQSNPALPNSPPPKSAPAAADDPTKKLGVFVGKWETEGAFASGLKTSTMLECRWSPMGGFLVCDQLVNFGGAEHRQFTVYSYDAKAGMYSYTTLSDPGAKPTSGTIGIKGNLWTYNPSSEAQGDKMFVTTNEFTDPKTEVFKVKTSDDGDVTWKTMLEGKATKIGD